MSYYVFEQKNSYKICFLVNHIDVDRIQKEYLEGINTSDVLLLDLFLHSNKKKVTASEIKEYMTQIEPTLKDFQVEYLVICNADYYKTYTKQVKAEANLGYIKEINGFKIIFAPDYKQIFYDPEKVRAKIQLSTQALKDDLLGQYHEPGKMKIKGCYPDSPQAIKEALQSLHQYDQLTCDIETFSLRPHLAGLASIGFAPNISEGIAFQIDTCFEQRNEEVRALLREFFETYEGTLIFHNIAFDATVLTYQLYMNDISDTEGLLKGLSILLKNFEDTKLIAYLATNSCSGNELGLKILAQEFAGNYAQEEIGDVSKIPLNQLLEYNLKDCLATWFVYNKYRPIMVQDDQEGIYKNLFLPATIDIVQMQLTGFPLNMQRVLEVEKLLTDDQQQAISTLKHNPIIINYLDRLKEAWVKKRNSVLKKKRVTIEDAKHITFNPRSRVQLTELFYEQLQLPIIKTTDKGSPSTNADTLQALMNHTSNDEILEILQALIDFVAVDKILTAFIPAFKEAVYSKKDNWHYLIGSFNLGGTVSGRLSSSKPKYWALL